MLIAVIIESIIIVALLGVIVYYILRDIKLKEIRQEVKLKNSKEDAKLNVGQFVQDIKDGKYSTQDVDISPASNGRRIENPIDFVGELLEDDVIATSETTRHEVKQVKRKKQNDERSRSMKFNSEYIQGLRDGKDVTLGESSSKSDKKTSETKKKQ